MIFVSLRTAASAEAAVSPMWFLLRLCERGEGREYWRKANAWDGGALDRCHGALLERLTKLGDALCRVDTVAISIEAAELIFLQTAKGRQECQWALVHESEHLRGGGTSAM